MRASTDNERKKRNLKNLWRATFLGRGNGLSNTKSAEESYNDPAIPPYWAHFHIIAYIRWNLNNAQLLLVHPFPRFFCFSCVFFCTLSNTSPISPLFFRACDVLGSSRVVWGLKQSRAEKKLFEEIPIYFLLTRGRKVKALILRESWGEIQLRVFWRVNDVRASQTCRGRIGFRRTFEFSNYEVSL